MSKTPAKPTETSEPAAIASAPPERVDADGVLLKAPDEAPSRLYQPVVVRKLWIVSLVILGLLVLLDLIVGHHTYFGIDGTFGFFAWYGLLTCVAMVVVSKKLVGLILTRKDSYYDD